VTNAPHGLLEPQGDTLMKHRAKTALLAASAIAAMLIGAGHVHAEVPPPSGPSGACFEIVPAVARTAPALLVDKCLGRTWQLVPSHRVRGSRTGALVYRWRALVRPDGAAPAVSFPAARRPVAAKPVAATGVGRRCFTFDGRKFCE
jgi:hypothetical protein